MLLANDTFLRCVDRFEQAKKQVLSEWHNPCDCENPGICSDCLTCPVSVELGQRIQAYLQSQAGFNSPLLDRERVLSPIEKRQIRQEKQNQVFKLFSEGLTYSEITRQTGVCDSTVDTWLYRAGLSRRVAAYDAAVKQQCLQLHAEGLPYKEIAVRTGVCPSSIYHWACDAGTLERTTLQTSHFEALRLQAIQMKSDGMNHQQIAQKLDVSPTSVENWARKADLPIGQAHRPHDPKTKQKCLELLEQGLDRQIISEQMDVPVNTLRRWQTDSRISQQPKLDKSTHPGVSCPHCSGQYLIKTGRNGGKQVYRCRSCQQHFMQPLAVPPDS